MKFPLPLKPDVLIHLGKRQNIETTPAAVALPIADRNGAARPTGKTPAPNRKVRQIIPGLEGLYRSHPIKKSSVVPAIPPRVDFVPATSVATDAELLAGVTIAPPNLPQDPKGPQLGDFGWKERDIDDFAEGLIGHVREMMALDGHPRVDFSMPLFPTSGTPAEPLGVEDVPVPHDADLDTVAEAAALPPIKTPRAARGVSPASLSLSPELRAQVGDVYRANRMYHGTSESSKEAIRGQGFSISKKAIGATANSFGEGQAEAGSSEERFIKNARKHNYLTSNHAIATQYALLATKSEPPAVVRVLHKLTENDPDAMSAGRSAYEDSFRTKKDIPPTFVLRSKRQPATLDEAKVFQKALKGSGINVTAEHAGVLLREEQSDSEDEVVRYSIRPLDQERAALMAAIARKKIELRDE